MNFLKKLSPNKNQKASEQRLCQSIRWNAERRVEKPSTRWNLYRVTWKFL